MKKKIPNFELTPDHVRGDIVQWWQPGISSPSLFWQGKNTYSMPAGSLWKWRTPVVVSATTVLATVFWVPCWAASLLRSNHRGVPSMDAIHRTPCILLNEFKGLYGVKRQGGDITISTWSNQRSLFVHWGRRKALSKWHQCQASDLLCSLCRSRKIVAKNTAVSSRIHRKPTVMECVYTYKLTFLL